MPRALAVGHGLSLADACYPRASEGGKLAERGPACAIRFVSRSR